MIDGTKLIGKIAKINDGEVYEGHYGYIIAWDGDVFHISGGSIDYSNKLIPIFDRDQFVIPRDQEKFRIRAMMPTWKEYKLRIQNDN